MIAMYKDIACTQKLSPNTRVLAFPSTPATLDPAVVPLVDVNYILVKPASAANAAVWLALTGLAETAYHKVYPNIADAAIGTISINVATGVISRSGFAYAWDFEMVIIPKVPLALNFIGIPASNVTIETPIYLKGIDGLEYRSCIIRATYNDNSMAEELSYDNITGVAVTPSSTLNALTGALMTGTAIGNKAVDSIGKVVILDGEIVGTIIAGDNLTGNVLIDNTLYSYTSQVGSWLRVYNNTDFTFSTDNGVTFTSMAEIPMIGAVAVPVIVKDTRVVSAEAQYLVNVNITAMGSEFTLAV